EDEEASASVIPAKAGLPLGSRSFAPSRGVAFPLLHAKARRPRRRNEIPPCAGMTERGDGGRSPFLVHRFFPSFPPFDAACGVAQDKLRRESMAVGDRHGGLMDSSLRWN